MTLESTFDKAHHESDWNWHPNAPGVERPYRDAFIMGSAMWIIWDGQTIYRRALYQGPMQEPLAYLPEKGIYNEKPLVTIDMLKSWKHGFKEAAGEEGICEEAKELALKSYRIMDALETSMGGC